MSISEENSRQITEALYKIADGLNTVAKVLAITKSEEPKKKIKPKRDPDAPRRNLTSYIYFSQEQREKVLEEDPSLNAKDVARVMGQRWNKLTDDGKAPYIKLAEQDKIRFQKETEKYNNKARGKETKEETKSEPKKVKAEKENKKTNKQAPAAVEEPAKKKAKSNDKKKSKSKSKIMTSIQTDYTHKSIDSISSRKELSLLDPQRNVSNTSTLSSIICVVAGTGIVGIPHALSEAGWMGLFFLVLSACMSQYTGVLLIRCLYYKRSDPLKNFADIGYAAFGRAGQIIGGAFSQFMLLLTPTIYIILASENISDILKQTNLPWLSRTACIWIIGVVVGVPFILVRNMRDVSLLSTFACMTTICLLLVVCVAAMSGLNEKLLISQHAFVVPRKIPIAVSTFSFSYCGNVVYPQIEASMEDPKRWPKVLLVSTCVISIIYFIMGVVGYLVYGNHVKSPIYKSLPLGASQNVAMLVITFHVILIIPFYLYVFTMHVESWLGVTESQNKLARTLIRTAEMVFCCVVAMFVPFFSDFMTLVGTLPSEALTFILPSLFWLKLSWHRPSDKKKNSRFYLECVACLFVASIGIFCAVFGTIDAVKELVHDYNT
ncbi:hypothetical protein K501DRAFT_330506 [Backusella circina FSU 941]|nr:hypothetical protein K501DRAFT_330506 [Backusella circina FSU 941]